MTSVWSHTPPPSPPAAGRPPGPPEAQLGGTPPPFPFDAPAASTAWPPSAPTAPPPPPRTPPASPRRSGGGRAVVAALAVTSLVGAGWIARDLAVDDAAPTLAAATSGDGDVEGSTPQVPVGVDEPVAAVAQALSPAVVMIQAGDGLGSGFVYDASGLVLTNAHVVGGGDEVEVVFDDGSSVEGEVLGSDELTDVAVVQIDPPNDLEVAQLADGEPRVGQLVVALGSPFGLDQTVTSGVVSAVGRAVTNPQGASVEMLQTDAPINPGNSGGALANRAGEVVGMPTLIYSESGENNGIGFAIPIQTALEVADRIVRGETLERGKLGVSTQPAADGSAGALVAEVESGSAADEAGFERGDVIVAIDGDPVKGSAELAARIQAHQPGDEVTLDVERDGETVTIEATLDRLGDR